MSNHLTDDDHDTAEDYEARKLQADYDAKCAELTRLQRLHEAAFVVGYGTGFGTPADEFDTNAAVARWKAGER